MNNSEENSNERPLLIKRYASRRLYNTETSDYVTLQEIAGIIRAGREVQIVDLKTGDDLTRQYLIQIIAEYEANGQQVLTADILTEIVRSYSDHATAFPEFLRKSFEIFQQNQQSIVNGFKQFGTPIVSVKELQERQREFFQRMMGGWTFAESPRTEQFAERANDEEQKDREIESIKRQLAELQSKVADL